MSRSLLKEPAAAFTVGASLLAKNVNDNACFLNKRGACEFFASKLAPTWGIGFEKGVGQVHQ